MWTVLPLKSLDPIKSRLATVLSPDQRKRLMKAMIGDALAALKDCRAVDGILLVTRDTEIHALAATYGAKVLVPDRDVDLDLNRTVQAACAQLAGWGVERCMIVHGDIPLVTPGLLSDLVEQGERGEVAILSCRGGQGSNVLITHLPVKLPFAYGPDSFNRHVQEARRLGLETVILECPEMSLDIDTPGDLDVLCRHFRAEQRWKGSRSREILVGLGLLHDTDELLADALSGNLPEASRARSLALVGDLPALMSVAAAIRDRAHGNLISYSRKVFIPLTHLCRDVCHYCTFAKTPRQVSTSFMSVEEVLEVARQGADQGCKEALLTLGEKPELRYRTARQALTELGFETTLDYVAHVAKAIFEETGLLPHVNAGCMDAGEIAMLREVAPSMGVMLESSSERLCEKGMPHYGSPDKVPSRRLATIALAGEAKVPFTSGILIGIGETRLERIESLLALRDLHQRYKHIQEIIVQNFRAKPGTLMAGASEPDLDDVRWTVAVARIIFGAQMSIQSPPNLVPGSLDAVIGAGINDLGGISPLTPDFVNPEAPWPHLETLARQLSDSGRHLAQRLTIYPRYVREARGWVGPALLPRVLSMADGQGFAREDSWLSGVSASAPKELAERISGTGSFGRRLSIVSSLLQRCQEEQGGSLGVGDIARLFNARGDEFNEVCRAADNMRKQAVGEAVSFVRNRNINYTNICYFKCSFCAFSKGKVAEDLREKPYNLGLEEIQRRVVEARALGATEVCLQGGIHPEYTGQHYIDICLAIKAADPHMHIHAFSPLEVWQGAQTLGIPLTEFLDRLRAAGLGSLPGTAAEILDDGVRGQLCADKISSGQWLQVMEAAHRAGLRSTATIMFGHVDRYEHWAGHLLALRELQSRTGGFTEFVPLPFVARMSPIYRRGRSRQGPTFREAVLMHAVSRLVLHPVVTNIQASWVKMGLDGVRVCLDAGVNDVGGTLINESITRSAGSTHGQNVDAAVLQALVSDAGRIPWQRTTLYKQPPTFHSGDARESVK